MTTQFSVEGGMQYMVEIPEELSPSFDRVFIFNPDGMKILQKSLEIFN